MTTLGNINAPTGLVTVVTGQQDFPANIIFFNPPVAATLAQVTTTGYLNQYAAQLSTLQMAVVVTSDKGTVLLQVTNSGANWQFAVPTETVAGVTYTGTLTVGHLVDVQNAGGVIQDSGIAANTVMLTAAGTVNQMGAGAEVLLDKGIGTESSHAVTINKQAGVITTTSLTTAGGASETVTLTNSEVLTTSVVVASVGNAPSGGNTATNALSITSSITAAGTVVFVITNNTAATALNGALTISFAVF